jgi:hypothetical protein
LRSDWISAGAIVSLTLATALRTPLPERKRQERHGGDMCRTLSNIGVLITIAELDRFVYTSGRAGGYGSPVATCVWCYMLSYSLGDRGIPLAV